jgi:YidC/Oxa1 family membrane protein insertase
MDRIQIGAIGLAVLMLVLWFSFLPQQPPETAPPPPSAPPAAERRGPEELLDDASETVRQSDAPEAPAPADAVTAERITIENDALQLVVSALGGRIESIRLKQYPDRIGEGSAPVELVTSPARGTAVVLLGDEPLRGLESVPHTVVRRGAREVHLRSDRNGVRVERVIKVDDQGYGGWIRVRVQNRGRGRVEPRFQLAFYGSERPSDALDRFQNYALIAVEDGDASRHPVAGLGSPGFLGNLFGREPWRGEEYGAGPEGVEWAGIESQYFLLAAIAENPAEAGAFLAPLGPDQGVSALRYPRFAVPPERQLERSYRVYFGPKVEADAVAVDPRLGAGLQSGWGWIRPLVKLFSRLLAWTYAHVVANYGLAIILLTILLRLVTYPLTQKSMKSMRRFSQIAPEMKELQEKHKGDRARVQQEMLALYQRKGINPVTAMGGGCLPMLIQFPFLIALYFALQGSIELRHAPFFGWIRDLSAPEQLFSVMGVPIRVLPLLMGGTMVLQQRMTPTAGVDPQQRQMMMWMSVMFIFLFYQFPSGLVLYWFVSNLLGIAQQLWVNRQPADTKGSQS